jgi:hypothetical protein
MKSEKKCLLISINTQTSIMSSVNSKPAMLAVIKVTKQAASKARIATLVIAGRLSGARAERPPIIIPIEPGFAKLQMANVAIADDLG